jgi:hypothetical protein
MALQSWNSRFSNDEGSANIDCEIGILYKFGFEGVRFDRSVVLAGGRVSRRFPTSILCNPRENANHWFLENSRECAEVTGESGRTALVVGVGR